jgi:PTS system nitrogen regulatory IIA component
MHFGFTLRLMRTTAGFSLRELAARVGVSSAYLSRVEHGHDPIPTLDRLASIARCLRVSPTSRT